MKIGRLLVDGPDGPVPRLVSVRPDEGTAVDLATAERLRLESRGASPDAARRLAHALFPPSMTAALGLGAEFHEAIARTDEAAPPAALRPLDGAAWLPPVDPPVMRDFNAFKSHSGSGVWYDVPIYFKINPATVIGHGATVAWPAGCEYMDYELELGLVIGTTARDLTPETAMRHVFGVTIFNDFSGRNLLRHELEGKLGPAKGKDFASGVGPWIVTLDELDPAALDMRARVNGEEWSRGSSASITWAIDELVAYASRSEPLTPGELIGTGTIAGGCGWELGRQLEPGDEIELDIAGIGILANTIGTPGPVTWEPTPRPRPT